MIIKGNKLTRLTSISSVALGFMLSLVITQMANAADKLSIALPGVPPVFSTVFIHTAKGAWVLQKIRPRCEVETI